MRKLCLLLALILAVGASAAMAETAATPIAECGDFTYIVLADGSAQIVDWEGRDRVLTVPSELDGLTVTSISESAFAGCESLAAIALPETVVEIGENAFEGCASLCSVTLPEGLLRIGDRAFLGCEGLTEIALPSSVTAVGANPFQACANLNDIFVSPDSPYLATINGVLFSKPDKRLVSYPMGLLADCYAVPEGIRTIGAMAFDRDLFLEEVVLPESVVEIQTQAFYGCDALTAMNLPSGITEIGAEALKCSNLTLTVEADSYAAQYVLANGIAATQYVLASDIAGMAEA